MNRPNRHFSNNYKHASAVIFDDHKMFSASFAALLEREGIFWEVNTSASEKELKDYFANNTTKRSVLFIDYFIPDTNTLLLINDIKRISQQVRVIVVTGLNNPTLAKRIILNGVDAILSKVDGPECLLSCLDSVSKGTLYLSPSIEKLLLSPPSHDQKFVLTGRELEILTLLSKSNSADDIAGKLGLSRLTINTHRRNMLSKSEFHSMTELIAYALRHGLISNE